LLLPYAILILVPYFAAFPSELEDAARIDGCTRWCALLRIILPLSTPGLAACGVILFILSWNELVIPLIVASRPEVMTVPVILAGLVSDYFVFFTLMMVICLLGLLPTLVLVLALQKYVVRRLVAGALKGYAYRARDAASLRPDRIRPLGAPPCRRHHRRARGGDGGH